MRFDDEQIELFQQVIDRMCPTNNIAFQNCEHVFQSVAERGRYTPDFSEFKLRDHIPIFVYETGLKNRGEFHPLLIHPKTRYIGEAYTATDRYILKSTFGDTYTVALTDNTMNPPYKRAHVRGEVYVICPKVLLDIDFLHRNGRIYKRELRNVFLRDQEVSLKSKSIIPSLQCYMYMGVPAHWDHVHANKKAMSLEHKTNKWMYHP